MNNLKRLIFLCISLTVSMILGVNQLCYPLYAEEVEPEEVVEIDEVESEESEEAAEEILVEDEATPEQIERSEQLEKELQEAQIALNQTKEAYDAAMEKKNKGSLGFFEAMGATSAVSKLLNAKYASYTDLGNWMDATSLDNMKATFDLMREGNYYRGLEGKSALKITHDLMAIAQSNTNISRTLYYHSFQYNVCENLSWYYADPYDGWYVDEKAVVEYLAGHPNASDQEIADALGFWSLDDVQTGHYYNLVDSYYKTTGFGIAKDKYGRKTYTQVFQGRASVSYTIDEYEAMFDNYCADINSAIDAYQIAENKYKQALAAYNEERVYKVTFDANGGTTTRNFMYVINGDAYGTLPEVIKSGCSFMGWATPSGEIVNESSIVNVEDDVTLVATFKEGSILPPTVGTEQKVESITFEQNEFEVNVRNSIQLNPIVNPQDVKDYTLTWESSNTAIASVDSKGMVTGKKAGTVTITVTANNGVSTNCKVTVKEESMLEGYSLFINGDIGMNFFMTLSSEDMNDTKSCVKFYLDGNFVGQVKTIDAKHQASYYAFPCYVPAKNMASEITAEFVSGTGEIKNTYKYSVEKYGRYIIDHADDFDTQSVEIAKAMLTYGRYVQIYFNYNKDALPGYVSPLKDIDLSSVKSEYTLKKENPSTTFVGARLLLTSKIGLKLYFIGNDTIYCNGKAVQTSKEDKYSVLTISDIDDMSEIFTITSDSFSLNYGIYTYAQKALQTSNTDLINLVKALVTYNVSVYNH